MRFIQTKLYENLLSRRQWLVIQKCLRIVYKPKWSIEDEDPYFGFKFICWENRSRYELYYTYEGGQRIEYDSGCQMQSICSSIFPTIIQIDELEYGKTAILDDRTEMCPKCGKKSTYSSGDYWFQS